MVEFIAEQARQDSHERATQAWLDRVPLLLPRIRQVVDVFQAALDEPEWNVSVRVDAKRPQFPLAVSCPFHGMARSSRPELFADLGEPQSVQADQLGHVVAEFLEWAAVGKGSGRRKLRLATPRLEAAAAEQAVHLRIAA